jgi:hypothetical protein
MNTRMKIGANPQGAMFDRQLCGEVILRDRPPFGSRSPV